MTCFDVLFVTRFCLATPSLSNRYVSPAQFLDLFTFRGYFRFETRWRRMENGRFAHELWIGCFASDIYGSDRTPGRLCRLQHTWPVRTHGISILAGWYLHWTLCNRFCVDCPLHQLATTSLSMRSAAFGTVCLVSYVQDPGFQDWSSYCKSSSIHFFEV